ncbi:AMP-binding protein, partial [Nonomuraea basaltis]|uniref:AMP-binding protein n=1 Tax=Nonomuraea basaltis TaxID=2495887 RepID=UPI00110C5048
PPLFQVRFLRERPAPPASYGGLEWRQLDSTTPPAVTGLTLRLTTAPEGSASAAPDHGASARVSADDGMSVRLDYATDLFDASTAERMLTHLRILTEAAAAEPSRTLSALPMLTPAEQARLIRDWPAGPPTAGEPRPVHRMMEEQAAKNPETVAVVAGEAKLTYGTLNCQANRLAHRLRELGAGPETRVGVVADRTTHTVVALLAVLKAGAAYVPLDPDHPAERQQFILADAGIEVLLAHAHHQRAAPDGTVVIDVDAFDGNEDETDPDIPVHPDNLAYVIYTSGSTGTPKGVLVSHGNLAHATNARWSCGRISPGIYCLPVPFTFDGAAAGLYWTLASGGRLVLPDAMTVHDPRRLGQLINLECATHFDAVPSQYEVLLSLCPRDLRSLRDISVGGEVLPPHVVAQHATMLPSATLYNDYGPTEATVWSTFHPCPPDFADATVPIGRPIPGTHVHILDDDLN